MLSYKSRGFRANGRGRRGVGEKSRFRLNVVKNAATFGCMMGFQWQGVFMELLFISVALVAAIGLLEFLQHHSE